MALELTLDPKTTALLLLDLQKGIVGQETQPHPAQGVVANAARLTERFRALGGLIVHVHVAFSDDKADILKPPTDAPPSPNTAGKFQGPCSIGMHEFVAFSTIPRLARW